MSLEVSLIYMLKNNNFEGIIQFCVNYQFYIKTHLIRLLEKHKKEINFDFYQKIKIYICENFSQFKYIFKNNFTYIKQISYISLVDRYSP